MILWNIPFFFSVTVAKTKFEVKNSKCLLGFES